MNSCILMVEIYDNPQLRHTPDGLEVTEMMVHIPGPRPDDPPYPLKVVGWGNMAKEIHQSYHQGDRVIVEGRLGMNTIERPEGFKEKKAELTVQKIHNLGGDFHSSSTSFTSSSSGDTLSSETTTPQTGYRATVADESIIPATTSVSSSVSVAPQVTNPEPVYQPTNFPRQSPPNTREEEIDPDEIPF